MNDFEIAQEAAQKAIKAFDDFGNVLAKSLRPVLDVLHAFWNFESEYKKQKYLRRYHRRGERMRKAGKL